MVLKVEKIKYTFFGGDNDILSVGKEVNKNAKTIRDICGK